MDPLFFTPLCAPSPSLFLPPSLTDCLAATLRLCVGQRCSRPSPNRGTEPHLVRQLYTSLNTASSPVPCLPPRDDLRPSGPSHRLSRSHLACVVDTRRGRCARLEFDFQPCFVKGGPKSHVSSHSPKSWNPFAPGLDPRETSHITLAALPPLQPSHCPSLNAPSRSTGVAACWISPWGEVGRERALGVSDSEP